MNKRKPTKDKILELLTPKTTKSRRRAMTADEIAAELGLSKATILEGIYKGRPAQGKGKGKLFFIYGYKRQKGRSGNYAIKWAAGEDQDRPKPLTHRKQAWTRYNKKKYAAAKAAGKPVREFKESLKGLNQPTKPKRIRKDAVPIEVKKPVLSNNLFFQTLGLNPADFTDGNSDE